MDVDLFIVGGGINGTGIAAEAASRGLSVTLCDKRDLAGGTSSASSKLIHGGLRYLETYEFSLVRKALIERKILMSLAPHLVSPLQFILPHDAKQRPAWLIRIGLFLYDHLIWKSNVPRSEKIDLTQAPYAKKLLAEFTKGFFYYDCLTDDARLVVTNALAAKQQGATILNYTECLSATFENQKWIVQCKNTLTDEVTTYSAKALVNAAGPWVDQVQQDFIKIHNPVHIKHVKGSHIVVPKLYDERVAYLLQNTDKRVVFVIPYQNDFSLIGTTDVDLQEDLNALTASEDEIRYLCECVNKHFLKKISATDVVWSYAGVRALQQNDTNTLSEITRDYRIELSQHYPLLTVISGKLTTYRCLSVDSVTKLERFFPLIKPAIKPLPPLPGGDFKDHDYEKFLAEFTAQFSWLPTSLAIRYAKNYGTRALLLLGKATSLHDLGQHFSHGLYEQEVIYLMQQEWAKTAEDILWRRTKLGLYFTKDQANYLQQVMQRNE